MKISKKTLSSFLFIFFLFTMISCDTNNSSKTEEEEEDKIFSNQEDAKLLVLATKNYIRIINYNKYIQTKNSLSKEIKSHLDSFNKNITERLNNLEEISRDELILIPHAGDISFLNNKTFDKDDKNQFEYLSELEKLIYNQLDVLRNLTKKSNHTALNTFANEATYPLKEELKHIKKYY